MVKKSSLHFGALTTPPHLNAAQFVVSHICCMCYLTTCYITYTSLRFVCTFKTELLKRRVPSGIRMKTMNLNLFHFRGKNLVVYHEQLLIVRGAVHAKGLGSPGLSTFYYFLWVVIFLYSWNQRKRLVVVYMWCICISLHTNTYSPQCTHNRPVM